MFVWSRSLEVGAYRWAMKKETVYDSPSLRQSRSRSVVETQSKTALTVGTQFAVESSMFVWSLMRE